MSGASADCVIDAHLQAIAARLAGPRRGRAAIVDELRDALYDAVEHHLQRGLTPLAAARAAVAEFGAPSVLAAAFDAERAAGHARYTVLGFLTTGPFLGVLWVATLVPGHTPLALLSAAPTLAPTVAAALLAGLLTLAVTGRPSRWLRIAPRLPLATAVATCLVAAIGDLTALTVLAARLNAASDRLPIALALAAATGSAARLFASQHAARRCLRTWASINDGGAVSP